MIAALFTALADPTTSVLGGATFPYFVEPGLRVGVRHQPARNTGLSFTTGGDLTASIDPRDRRTATLAGTAGAMWLRDSGFGLTLETGLAAALDHETVGESVAIATGKRQVERRWVGWLVPQVTGRLSIANHRPLGGYLGLTWGHEIGFGRRGAMQVQGGFGVVWRPGGER